MGVLTIRALLFVTYLRAREFWTLPVRPNALFTVLGIIVAYFSGPSQQLMKPHGSKLPQHGVYMASLLGIVIMLWDLCFILGYLGTWTLRVSQGFKIPFGSNPWSTKQPNIRLLYVLSAPK